MHSWDPLLPCFSMSDKFSPIAGGVPTPATIFPLLHEDLVNNHASLGVSPPNTDTRTLCQVRVTPHKSEGIEPFTMVNSLPCQVGVTPRSSGGIEPSTWVNSPPGKVGAAPLHLINTPSGPHEVATLASSWVPVSISTNVAPVLPLTSSTSVLVLITDSLPPVMPPLCPLPLESSFTSLKTMQAMSHEQPVD